MLAPVTGKFSLQAFMDLFVGQLLSFYAWTNSIYPFTDFQISLFWIFESSVLAALAWQLFPAPVADTFVDIEEMNQSDTSEFYSEMGTEFVYGRAYEDWEDDEHDVF